MTTITTKIIPPLYDDVRILKMIETTGAHLYGPEFRIIEAYKPAILRLVYWFLKDDDRAQQTGIDLDKGLLLTGPVGCGTTAVMRILHRLCDPERAFLIRSCQQVALDFSQEGFDIIRRYTARSFCEYNKQPRTVCFDGLGIEPDIPFFGSAFNVMAEILSRRYDLFVEHGMLTHITTNLNSDEIEDRYAYHIRSRMRRMLNLIAFPQTDADKR